MKVVYLDFEFNRVVEPELNLVCAVTKTEDETTQWWLHNDKSAWKALRHYLKSYDLIIGFSCVAEARSILTLGMNPLSREWIDLFLEYRCITNHNDELSYGKQLKDGKVITTFKPKPKWEQTDEDKEENVGFKPTHSLAEATYKLLEIIRDTKHKDEMRELIISDPVEFTPEQRQAIMNYCQDDVELLPKMYEKIKEHFFKKDRFLKLDQYEKEAKWRGRYAAHTAIMESKGYPIDVEKTKNFSSKVGSILYDVQREINELFPDIKPFRWNKAEQRFSWNQSRTREWIETLDTKIVEGWMLTDGGKKKQPDYSLSLEAFQRFFDFKHDYPKDNFGAQIVRYLKLKQNLFGFQQNTDKDKKSFWDNVGSDGRVRPYMNIYGAQSSRSQPASTGFMFLKPAWMRALVQPAKGKFMAGIDFSSQEFFLSALESGDPDMIEAYLSGDPYLYFAKLADAVPADGKRKDYEEIREAFKSTVLGISYLMTKYGLAIKLTTDTGKEWTELEAEEQIKLFNKAFHDFYCFRIELMEIYEEQGFLKLKDGWYMWGDNPNVRSASNMPIQGMGAAVMRKAVDLAVAKGIFIPFTLHDALYMEDDIGNEYKIKILDDCMREAFAFYYKDDPEKYEKALKIRLDPKAWSPDYQDGEIDIEGYKIPVTNLHIDKRAIKDYEAFSKYFVDSPTDLL